MSTESKMVKKYQRMAEKARRKMPSAEALMESAANFERKFAELSAKAAKLPALQEEHRQLEHINQSLVSNIALLAAQISPEAFNGSRSDMRAAVILALKRLQDAREILHDLAIEQEAKEKQQSDNAERLDLTQSEKGFQRIVKLITGQMSWDRALAKFKRYITAKKVTLGSDIEKVLGKYRETWETDGCKLGEIVKEIRDLNSWWEQEKKQTSFHQRKGKKEEARSGETREDRSAIPRKPTPQTGLLPSVWQTHTSTKDSR